MSNNDIIVVGIEELTDSNSGEESEVHISVNALTGNQSFGTIRVSRLVHTNTTHILVDSISTHNFLDIDKAKKLGCIVEHFPPQSVVVFEGNNIHCSYKCRNFKWFMNKQPFEVEVLLISLGGCDMVLGVQWLRTLGKIS